MKPSRKLLSSVIFFTTAEQEATALAALERFAATRRYGCPVVTEIVPATPYFRAEASLQQFVQSRQRPMYR